MDFDAEQSLKEWTKDKPLSILQLDAADRLVLRIADERDAIQKKTFTKWVNKHLKKANNRHVNDLFLDLQDGLNLISLLEVLSGERLPRERGSMRFHMLQNVQMALDFLRFKKIKLVNIRADDIVDGNPKLTLGLIWTIILHFQISDIVMGAEPNVSARDALLKWARRTTSKYPGVRVSDFTSSWRDGLAFNAIIHRNRPDLVDWRTIRNKHVRERLEHAFYTAEREYGVTRLLDPEDVDTHEIDEKSIITYISSLYDVFPEPPAVHPLYDSESQQRVNEYCELASSLHLWMREKTAYMQDRNFPSTLIEMKKLAADSARFRTEEVPPRQRDKQRLQHIFQDLTKYFEDVGEVDIDPELHIDVIERNWSRLLAAHQEKDSIIQDEIKRLDRLQRLAEKVTREMKRVDGRLEELESRINEEARRLDRLHPLDAKHNVDVLEHDLRQTEENINTLFSDVQTLREGRYPQASDLHKRVQKLHQRWVALRSLLHSRLVSPLASMSFPVVEERTVTRQTRTVMETRLVDTNTHFRALQEAIEWVKNKMVQIQEADYGSDLQGVQAEIAIHQREQNLIEQFHTRVEQCIAAKSNFHGEELALYNQHLNTLQKLYAELLSASSKRMSDLETLQDFLQSATNQLVWLNEKEEIEVSRDWTDKDLNIPALEHHYENLMSDLEKREIQFSAVQDRGEALILQHHPAAKCIEAYMAAMQSQWAWLLQLALCLETHLKHAAYYHQFWKEMKDAAIWINKRDELLNGVYSQSEFTLEEGEALLKGMQELREELNQYSDVISNLGDKALKVVPLKQRRLPVTRPLPIHSICSFKQSNINIEKGEQWILHDNSGRIKWRVSNGANDSDCNVPGVVFLIPPPDKEALDAVDRLKRVFDRTIALWQRKQLRMRQNMIFATIRVVKRWDLEQFLAMGAAQRNAIRKALNEDADKLLEEGDPSDPQLRRLRREMDEVNRLFDEFERRARAEEEMKNATKLFQEKASNLQSKLDEAERTLHSRINAPVPRDLDSLEHLVLQHKDFESSLKALTPEVESLQSTFRNISPKTPILQGKLDKILNQWNSIWNLSHLYVDRLKSMEIVLSGMDEANNLISDFEIKLASYGELPSDIERLNHVYQDLLNLQRNVTIQQSVIDQLNEDSHNSRRLIEKSRHNIHHGAHPDLDRVDSDVKRINQRWNNLCSQLVERLRGCENAMGLLTKLQKSYQTEVSFLDESYNKLNNLTPVSIMEQIEPTKALYTSILERAPLIEHVNIDGARFIQEAKLYNLQLKHYRDWLIDEVHPSLDDGENKRLRLENGGQDGETALMRDLNVFNQRYTTLVAILYDRLLQFSQLYPQNESLKRIVEEMRPHSIRTYRSECETIFNEEKITSVSSSVIRSYDITDGHVQTKSSSSGKVTISVNNSRENSPALVIDVDSNSNIEHHKTNGKVDSNSSTPISDILTFKRVQRVEEGIGTNSANIIDTPGILDPSTGQVLTVGDAIRLRILDVRSGKIAKSLDLKNKNNYVNIQEAVKLGLVNSSLANRLLGPCGIVEDSHKPQLSLLEAIQRELMDAERGPLDRVKQAIEEKYRSTDDQLTQLLDWVGEIEDRLANQDVAQEDLELLRNQINFLKLLKEEIDSQSRPVTTCLDQLKQLVATGAEFLSRDEITSIEKKGKQLRTRYDRVNVETERLVRQLTAARDELSKFRMELGTFTNWMESARRNLDEKERLLSNLQRIDSSNDSIKELVSDIIAHQADLRFITMAAQKFFDESKEYLNNLNNLRATLPARLSHLEPAKDSVVRSVVTELTAQYKDLLNRANALSDRLSGVGGRQREFKDALEKARAWMREAEPRASKVISEPLAADPTSLQDQLHRTKAVNNEFIVNGHLIDNAKTAVDALLRSLQGQISPSEVSSLKGSVKELEDKYKSLCDMLAEKCKLLDQALAQSQGVQDALDQLAHWLSDAENQLKNITRPAALVKERLEEQMREQRVFQADLDSHRASVDSVAHSAQEIIHNASNPRLAKKIETKLRDVTSRFEKLLDKCAKRGEFLTEIHNSLTSFNGQASSVERWLNDVLAAVQLPDAKIDDIAAQRDSQRDSLEQTLRNGRNLIAKKDVTETGGVRDRVKTLENLWKELNLHLDEKQRLGKQRTEQLVAYEKLRDQVIVWLNTFENRVEKLEPIAVDIEIVKKQAEQIKPLIKEHRDYAMTIDKLNDLGSVYDALTRPDAPGKRRSSSVINPPKKVSLASVSLRRTSQDIGAYSSRRASQDFGEDLSPIQQELGEINHRYSVLGSKLNDRHNELELTRDELRKLTDHLKTLSQFLDKIHRALPKESVPHTKEEADKTVKIIKNIIEDMYEKQSMLDSTKSGIRDLLRKKPNALGADQLANELENVCARWKSIADGCKNRIQFLEDVKEFYDTHDNLNNWLNAKDRMMTVLGPISSDPRMVQSQVQQVQVLREEFRTQQPQLHHLTSKGESVLARIGDPNSPDSKNVEAKLKAILEKWADLLGKLDERAASLGAAADTAREFDAALTRLKDNLQNISDQLDDIPLDKEPEEQLRKLQNLERQLEGQRPLLADLEAAGASLCDVLSDPASKAEIQGKLSAINRQYNNLQKKLDHKKAELEGLLKDGRQFEASCAQTLGWLSEGLGALSERLLVSADREILQQQLEHHEPIYKDVLSKEHEVIMLLNKGRELLARNSYQQQRNEARSQQRDLDKIQQHWDKLRKDVSERHTRLQTCMEHCKKYYRALETFLPWLSQAENKMDQLRPESFKRRDIERQLRELSAFRNDIWKHSGEYENLKHLGETFLMSCDVDKEIVKQELADVKTRWDKLNNDLHAKTQWLEDMSRRLADFSENLRDLGHNVQRCEDKLQSHDSLGGAGRDPKLLDRIKTLREDVAALKKPLGALRQTANDLVAEGSEAGVGDATHLRDDVDGLGERIEELASKLDDRCAQLQSASTALTQYNDQVKALSTDLSALEHELDNMKPPGRDVKTVKSQQDDLSKFIKKLVRTADDVANAVMAGERLVDSGFAPDTVATREQAESLNRQLNKLDEKARNREDELEKILEKLNAFQQAHTRVLEDINQASEDLRRLKPVGSEVEAIKSQKDEFAALKRQIEPLGQSVDACNKTGQGLVQSAAAGVNTSLLEKDLEKLNDKWNALKEKLNERSRKLDIGLLQSGKFQEALDSFAKWLTDTEEMVANQKPPSADYKVVKAQLQEQKFLKKMLADRQHSMSSLFQMGNEVAANADPAERKAIERQLNELMTRFDNLNEGASQRMDALEQAMAVAKQFQDKLTGILDWLDKSEKKIKDMELIPTDEEKIQQRIREHDALHKEILRKKPDFTELTDIASSLMGLVGEDEAAGVADKLQDTADRYGALVEASDNLGQLLQASKAGLRHLVLTYQDLQAWMENMEARLNRYKVLPVHTEKLIAQMEDLADLTEEIANKQNEVDGTVDSGFELMKHISSDEALQLKDKLDSLQRRYNELTARGADMLKHAQEALPLVQQFHNSHHRLVDWMLGAEATLQAAEPREEEISRLEADIQEFRPVLENINLIGPQLCQISPGEGASTIEGLVTRDNRRFDAIVEQIQRKAERIHLSKQRSLEVISDIDELLDWFREVESNLREAEPPSSEPDVIRVQLKEHKALNDDISSQKTRVRDVLSTAKKVLRESPQHEDTSVIREKMEDLRESMETVSGLSSDRLGILEQALPLAEHFHGTHGDLSSWMNDMERQVSHLALPALRPDLIAQQQDKNEQLLQSIAEHKPLVDKLNKTGEALIKLTNDEEGAKVQEIMDTDNARYNALKVELRQRQQALEKALQESSQFSDKLEGMLRALANTADQVAGAEPISAHPPKIHDQIDDNNAMIEDLDKREEAFQAVKKAANDVINKAPNSSDPAVRDIKKKLERLNGLWNEVQKATNDRGRSLEEALALAEKFWKELQSVMATLRDLQDNLNSQEPPAVEPKAIQQQQYALKEIKAEIDQTKPEVEQCRASGQKLMKICGEPDKPEVKKHIEDLDSAWDTVTALFAKREENLIHAMEKAMEFHETLQDLLKFLERAEDRFAKLGPLGSDIDAVKKQIAQLKQFKADVDPHMVQVEALNRQAQELTERTSAEQAASLKEPLASVNRRWDELLRAVVERQRQLENALLRLGQFQHALAELMAWIDNTNRTLDNELKPVAGDTQLLEIELAKLKVLMNDIQAHQNSVDTLNYAGRQLIESGKGSDEASSTQDKLNKLNKCWRDLLQKAADRQTELEEALKEAQRFSAEIQDLLSWLSEVDGVIAASKPVGGLPETASEQLERFMEVYNELEENRPKVETVLAQGQEYLKKSPGTASNLQQNLKTLKQRWDSVTARANDKKIKLEIALKEATEFHDSLQAFVDWLTNAEKTLSNLKPVSRVLPTILQQIEEHKAFQKDVGVHRETMLHLDKKGTHLKYFSQKQDVILIKNLLISVQHRWERVVAKSAERTRALDHGYKEAREFHDAWSGLMSWLTDTEKSLDDLAIETQSMGNDPDRIKQRLAKHRDFQRALSGKQGAYDSTMRCGKTLKDKAPKTDEPQLRQMMNELKEKWNTVCSKAVDRQRKLEEALLYCGQFKDALEALLDWLRKTEKILSEDTPVHGDLDTVMALVEQHKAFEGDLESRALQMESVKRTGKELEEKANATDAAAIRSQLNELTSLWSRVNKLTERKTSRLEEALKEAEQLHKAVHTLLEWLSDAEMKLRFVNSLPEDDQEARLQLAEHEKFLRELAEKEIEKDATIALAQRILVKAHPDGATVIKHWITIIQSRWEEVSSWAKQREDRLRNHLRSLQDLDSLLEELLEWLAKCESHLLHLEAEPLPDDIPSVEILIEQHKEFMEATSKRQHEVDSVCKARIQHPAPDRKQSGKRMSTPGLDREDSPELYDTSRKQSLRSSRDNLLDRRGSRASPSREKLTDNLPHYGPRFPPKGSKGSEPQFRNPRCRLLWDTWRNVWLLAWERQRRLQERLNYLIELEKVKNFSWDDWRKRFLRFMNHKKSRLTDLFRKMDKNNDGLIPREDFVDGIIKTKFETSKLEMGAVADMFDHDFNPGLIDWKEFIAALRPDWEEKQPNTESEKIHDEVKRLVQLCTCRQKFRVFQVGEGKYRFGDSQKLRLVRILRSTVMVRVGGGWVALDEFLVKNDPCRAKGRTNIELREQFILAEGVSQTMSAFKPKSSPSPNQQRSLSVASNAGPITKVREKSSKSIPMGKTGVNRSAGTPDSLSDNESPSYSRTPLKKPSSVRTRSSIVSGGSLPGSRNNSRPPSRTGSKPPSRHGSNLSLDSTDDGTPSRIPRRSTTSSRSSTGTTTPHKLGVPSYNGNSTTRSRSPSGYGTPKSNSIHRASSIPTLSGSGLRARTPSGSSTPVPSLATGSASGTRLQRKSSGASDTLTGLSRKSTPTDPKAPFRL